MTTYYFILFAIPYFIAIIIGIIAYKTQPIVDEIKLQKIDIIARMPEIQKAVYILLVLKKDIGVNWICMEFEVTDTRNGKKQKRKLIIK